MTMRALQTQANQTSRKKQQLVVNIVVTLQCAPPFQQTELTLDVFISPQWGAADAEIKVPFGENTEFKRSPFKVWSRSVYSHTCYAYCQEFLPRLFLPLRSIHLHFFQNLSQFFPVLAVANIGSCVGPQNKTGHPVGCRFPRWVPPEYE